MELHFCVADSFAKFALYPEMTDLRSMLHTTVHLE